MYNNTPIDSVQIETSSMCNAACPQCSREWWDGDYSRFKQTFIPTEFYENRIPQYVYDNLKIIDFCGTVGDPCTAPNFIEVCRVIKRKNPGIVISVATNGGMKSTAWWAELATVLTWQDRVIFGIDGLEDVNGIYRVNVKWAKLMNNAQSFIDAGGRAHWQMIMFQHNEHQYAQAEELSKTMGFDYFFKIFNHRYVIDEVRGRIALGSNGQPLRPPSSRNEQSIILHRKTSVVEDRKKWSKAAETSQIDCQAIHKREAYITAEMHLMPCCFIAGSNISQLEPAEHEFDGYHELWDTYGKDKIQLDLHDWQDILNGQFFSEVVSRWNKKFNEGRVLVCSMVCNKNKDLTFSVYNTNDNI